MRNGVLYARTEEGLELPVIDVTNPAFAVSATEEDLEAMLGQYIQETGKRQEMTVELREALQASIFGRALMAASGTFLDGMSTYRLKLGPENLGADATPIDRRIAGSFPAYTSRIRLADMARLLAEGLAVRDGREPRRDVCLVNIGGGAGADSWNALIHLQREQPELLEMRKIGIAVMDVDERGPAFGAKAVEALGGVGAPLEGMAIGFKYFSYEWSETERLRVALDGLGARQAVCGVSSEGGLLEYGADEEIVGNLNVLHGGTAGDAIVVGSVTREGEAVRASARANRVATRPRTMEAFRALAEEGGWAVDEVIERAFSYNVRLVKR
ncbi:MAG: hypothetical protein ACHQIK_14350 [Candidatus Acidiferrales bacterium]